MNKLKYLYYRFMWNIAPFLPQGKFVHLDLELNNTCNQKCIFCWHSTNPPPREIMSLENISSILFLSKKLGAMSVKFNLRGEPLLGRDILPAIKQARELKYTEIMINTNGSLLFPDTAKLLSEFGLTKCIISMDSFEKDIYEKLHQYEFERVFKNLVSLHGLKIQEIVDFNVEINIHINQYNKDESFERWEKFFYLFKFVYINTQNREGEQIALDLGTRKRKTVCPHMMRRLTVHADGSIYPCCVSYNKQKDIMLYDYVRIDVAYLGLKRHRLIRNYINGIYTESCKACTSQDIWIK